MSALTINPALRKCIELAEAIQEHSHDRLAMGSAAEIESELRTLVDLVEQDGVAGMLDSAAWFRSLASSQPSAPSTNVEAEYGSILVRGESAERAINSERERIAEVLGGLKPTDHDVVSALVNNRARNEPSFELGVEWLREAALAALTSPSPASETSKDPLPDRYMFERGEREARR